MKGQMAEQKQSTDVPTIIIKNDEIIPPKSRLTKKIVLLVVGGILIVALILTAILVGMYMFTEAQKDIFEYSYYRDKDTKEEVASDLNTNTVEYHVNGPTYEAWVVNDFNRDIQVMKIRNSHGTNCYVTALNRTAATDPSRISDLSKPGANNETYYLIYTTATTPISDSSFLAKKARDTCYGISTYWIFPTCDGIQGRQKRWGISFEFKFGAFSITISFSF